MANTEIMMYEGLYQQLAAGHTPDREQLVALVDADPNKFAEALQKKALVDIAAVERDMGLSLDKEEQQALNTRLTHLRWMAERLLPKVFGNKQQVEVTQRQTSTDAEMTEIVENALAKVLARNSN